VADPGDVILWGSFRCKGGDVEGTTARGIAHWTTHGYPKSRTSHLSDCAKIVVNYSVVKTSLVSPFSHAYKAEEQNIHENNQIRVQERLVIFEKHTIACYNICELSRYRRKTV